jgi:glycosyltransferase involved in cell wall biosynthesis
VKNTDPEVSVVLPIFNERDNLAPLMKEIETALHDTTFEIVAVDDGSTDGSLDELHRLRTVGPLRVVALERRVGQSGALMAGVTRARGHLVVTMDADGQNVPSDGARLLGLVRRGECDAAVGYRERRADSSWKRFQSRVANAARNWITGDQIRDTGCSLRVAPRAAMQSLPRFDGMHRFVPTLLRWEGIDVMEVAVGHRRRAHGVTKYGMWDRLWVGLRDAFGVRWLRQRQLHFEVKRES